MGTSTILWAPRPIYDRLKPNPAISLPKEPTVFCLIPHFPEIGYFGLIVFRFKHSILDVRGEEGPAREVNFTPVGSHPRFMTTWPGHTETQYTEIEDQMASRTLFTDLGKLF
ncbi:hypothetical protein RRG08_020824 [Elysia crispata]|uniref:Uncharacterized protein n=1 Tax=Elysia crispata TaxID=231223 RepID=A0AAE0XUX9_9GAST|nr:hypothetical protein RRG08_020824 [Elysia crispata]